MNSIKPAIDALETIYEGYKHLFPNLADSRPVITIQAAGRRKAAGWMSPKRWQNGQPDAINEINVSAECLNAPLESIADTVLHEMVHHSHNLEGVKDCSKSQYHNKQFKAGCERVGLNCEQMGRYGWAQTSLTDARKAELSQMTIDDNAFTLFRQAEPQNEQKQTTRMKKWICGCEQPQIIRAAGEIDVRCNKCGIDFFRG